MTSALHARWKACFESLALPVPEGAFDTLVAHYREPHRAYHTLEHVGECLDALDLVTDAKAPGTVGLALWFHDAIYDPRAADNEEKSAALASTVMKASHASADVVDAIERLILATKHDAVATEHDAKIVVDIDLSILGAEEKRFRKYEVQIRREYAYVEESAFRRGRREILATFLQRPFIYSRADFRGRLEARARANILRALGELSR